MERPGVKGEEAGVQHLEPLIIIEEGDVVESVTGPENSRGHKGARQEHGQVGKTTAQSQGDGDGEKYHLETEQVSEETKELKRGTVTEEENRTDDNEQPGDIRPEDKKEMDETERQKTGREDRSQDGVEMTMKGGEGEADLKVRFATDTQVLQADANGLVSADQTGEQTLSLEEAEKQARRLTPDFPDALYELLCTLQEGRRLNDQRCSFRREGRRRCHSEPSVTRPAHRVTFSSMTSLQTEEFFDMVAVSQARRLDDQRADLLREAAPPKGTRAGRLRSSLRLSLVRKPAAPLPVPKEDLYNMILTSQAQGRLEDQRSAAPGPVDDEDFFSLLLRVQGGRMEEQRTELPLPGGPAVQT